MGLRAAHCREATDGSSGGASLGRCWKHFVNLTSWNISQNHRITAWLGLEGTSVGHPVQPPAEAGSPRAGCTGPCPGGA